LIEIVFLRDVLAARLPDVVAPIAVLVAAIAGHLWSSRAISRAAIAALAVVFLLAAVRSRDGPAGCRRPWTSCVTGSRDASSRERVADIQPNPASRR